MCKSRKQSFPDLIKNHPCFPAYSDVNLVTSVLANDLQKWEIINCLFCEFCVFYFVFICVVFLYKQYKDMTITNSFWFANTIIYLKFCGVNILGISSEQQVMTDSHQSPSS